jgi:predicted RNA methylase
MKVDQEILAILDAGECVGARFILGPEKLDRKTYEKVNRVLELAGGRWNRSAKAHLFEGPKTAEEHLEEVIQTGEITDAKKEFQFFETTAPVVNRILHAANLNASSRVLEPSAGHGAVALRAAETAKEVVCIELNDACVTELKGAAPANVIVHHAGDFLGVEPLPTFSHVLMNPPFSKAQDAKHIVRAFEWLEKGGRLVSVASAGVTFRRDKAYQALRDLIDAQGGTVEELPEGSFQASGTMVNTVLIVIDK